MYARRWGWTWGLCLQRCTPPPPGLTTGVGGLHTAAHCCLTTHRHGAASGLCCAGRPLNRAARLMAAAGAGVVSDAAGPSTCSWAWHSMPYPVCVHAFLQVWASNAVWQTAKLSINSNTDEDLVVASSLGHMNFKASAAGVGEGSAPAAITACCAELLCAQGVPEQIHVMECRLG